MLSNGSVNTGKYTAIIVDVEVSNNVRFGRYVADVYKPVYKVGDNTVRDNGIFMYKRVEGFLYDSKKNWGYARFLTTMGVKRKAGSNEGYKFTNLIGEIVEIEVYEKIFNNEFSKRVGYPVAKVLKSIGVPFW